MKEGPKAIRCILAHFKGKNLRRCDREQQLMTSRPILRAQKGRINKDAMEGGALTRKGGEEREGSRGSPCVHASGWQARSELRGAFPCLG